MRLLADLLGQHSEKISRSWLERVGKDTPSDGEPELRAHLPRLLRDLALALEQAHAPANGQPLTSPERFAHRAGFHPEAVAREYTMLQDCILDTVEEEHELVRVVDVRALSKVFAAAIASALNQHAAQQQTIELAHAAATKAATLAAHTAIVAQERELRAVAQAERDAQHALFMQAPVAIAILEGPEHRITFANPACRALANGRDVLGKPLFEAMPNVHEHGFDALLDRVIESGEPYVGKELPIKLEHHRRDEYLYLNLTYSAKRNAEGRVDGLLMSGSDVTEQVLARHRVEALAEEVRLSELELRSVADVLPLLVSFVTSDERYALVNKAYEDWFGVTNESMVGRSLLEIVGDAAYALMRPYVQRALAGERFSFEQYDVPYRLGGTRDVKVWFVPRWGVGGVVDGYVAALQDITQPRRIAQALQKESLERLGALEVAQRAQQETEVAREKLQEALSNADSLIGQLAEAELLLRSLVNNLPELAWSADAEGNIGFYNQRWFEYTGTTLEEVQGWRWDKVHDPEILPKVVAHWKHCLSTGTPFEMEFPLRKFDGTFQWFLTRVRPLHDGHGKLVRWIGTNTNIHEQREASNRAEEASRAKDEFLATASHELRTPLTAILGWARLLRSGQMDPSAYARGLETIERNAKAQVQLIEDILDGSRIITGKLHLEIRPLDMTTLVRAALDAVRPAAEAKGIELTVNLDPAAARIVGDPERLQQVVWNLANNAVKFTPKGGRVEVRLERSGTSIELIVSDSGQGIAAEFLPFVFDRFRQAEGSTTRRHGGLGLGLALVRHLVEAHGGTVRAESEGNGRGARFVALLPVQAVFQAADSDRPVRTTDQVAKVEGRSDLTGVTILVVDDEEDARDLVATVLRSSGARVTTAGSAAEALAAFAKGAPMLLISDIGMPQADGYELMRRVRNLTGIAGAQVPAIALTAYSREQDRRLALEAGFQTHVSKPVEPTELIRVATSLVQFVGRQTTVVDRGAALERADAFLKFDKILDGQGILDALRFLNNRTSHRFTAIYRIDPPLLRNLFFVDSYLPEVKLSEDAPLNATYCSIVGRGERTFTTEDTRADDRLVGHPARDTVISYCGVLLRDAEGNPFGTLCHFDVVPSDVPVSEMPLMEAAAPLLMRAIQKNTE